MTPTEIAQCSNHSDAFNAIYQDSEMMLAWLASASNLRDKIVRALKCDAVAADPGYRFRLTIVPDDVKSAITAFISACSKKMTGIRDHVQYSRAQGIAWDTTWNNVPGHLEVLGFGPGDSQLLDVPA